MDEPKLDARLRIDWRAALVAAFCVIMVALVNPFKEAAFVDDWANADTVRRLLETGQYRLNDWLAPNILFQAYWGALFSRVMGLSFVTLRFSTIVLAVAGVAAFWKLAREIGYDRGDAGLLAFILVSSPLWFGLSLTFQSDVPFTALVMIALWLYVRALRAGTMWAALIAGVAASAAILTRQFGVVLPLGFAVVWWGMTRPRLSLPALAAGIIPPAVAFVWQFWQGITAPNWSAAYSIYQTRHFLFDQPVTAILLILWRVVATFQHLALMCLPLVVLAAAELGAELRQPSSLGDRAASERFTKIALTGLIVFFGLIGLIGAFVVSIRSTMPLLPSLTSFMYDWPPWATLTLTFVTFLGGVMIARLIALPLFDPKRGWRGLSNGERLVMISGVVLLVTQLPFFSYQDRYVMALVPFVLLIIGKTLTGWMRRLRWAAVGAGMVIMLITALWARALLDERAAYWGLGDSLLADGIDARRISANWEWDSYQNNEFETYLDKIGRRADQENIINYVGEWLPERRQRVDYVVAPVEDQGEVVGYAAIRGATYLDMWLGPHDLVILKRDDAP